MFFALFGLVQGASLEGLVADYSKTMADLYVGLTSYFLIRHGHMRLLKTAACAASCTIRHELFRTYDGIEGDLDLPSWVSIATFQTSYEILSERRRFQDDADHNNHTTQYSLFPKPGRRSSYTQAVTQVPVRPIDCHPLQTSLPSLTAYRVFGNHGALFIRAFPVVHIPQLDSLLHDAFTFVAKQASTGSTSGLMAIGTPIEWSISVFSGAPTTGSDDWIIEAPGCDTFLRLQASGQVSNTYKISSLCSVALLARFRHQRHYEEIEPMEIIDLTPPSVLDVHYWPIQRDQLCSVQVPAVNYRFWMPLISCDLQHLHFLKRSELRTRKDTLLAPRQSE